MARKKSKETPKIVIEPGETAGFYKRNGETLRFAPTAVHFPGGSSIEVAKHSDYTYPVEGWTYHESAEAAYSAEGLEMPAPKPKKDSGMVEMSREERDAERIARLEKTDPERAAQLKIRAEQRQERMAHLQELRAAKVARLSR
jgi:hypothetical protein